MRINKTHLIILLVIGFFQNCDSSNASTSELQNTSATSQDTAKVTINVTQGIGRVSSLLMGFNIVYDIAPDHIWEIGSGKVPKLLEGLGTRILRWPAGTVTTFYHWNHLTGQGHRDSWNSSFDPSKNKKPSSFMDLNEYLDVCQELKTEPLIGINMGSGMKYHRVQDGIEEAKKLMQHCLQRGIKVKYFYLGNEPYRPDANYTFTAAEYADMVNQYGSAMRKIDDQIKIIVNTFPIYRPPSKADHLSYTRTLISKAGANIDFIDVHDYWTWGHATYDHWKSQINMEIGSTGMTYRDQRSFYKKLAASLGYPEIEMITLEWNIGPPKNNTPPTQSEAALMVAEQFMQLIQSGMKMATFWPIYWPGNVNWSSRALLNAHDNYEPHKVYGMFNLYKNIMGQEMIKSSSSDTAIQVLSVKSLNSDTLWVYAINKNKNSPFSKINLQIKDFKSKKYNASGFDAKDESIGPLEIKKLQFKKTSNNHFTFNMPQYSFAKITLIK